MKDIDLQEERKTSETGGQKGQKLARFDLIPFTFLWELALVCGKGAIKYDDDNWRKGYSWRLSFGAMQRHLSLFWTGEDRDEETGLHHLAHAGWHCFVLFVYSTVAKYAKFDDRPDKVNNGKPKPGSILEASQEIQNSVLAPFMNGGCAPNEYQDTAEGPIRGNSIPHDDRITRTECILGHSVAFIDEKTGYIDGEYLQGTAFTAPVKRYREGFESIDDAMAAAYAKEKV